MIIRKLISNDAWITLEKPSQNLASSSSGTLRGLATGEAFCEGCLDPTDKQYLVT